MLTIIWDQFLNIAKEEVGSRVVDTWFKSISLHRWDPSEKTVYVYAPNEFIRDWVQKNYITLLRVHLGRLLHVDQPKVLLIEQKEVVEEATIVAPQSVAKIVPAQGMKSNKSSYNRIVPHKAQALLNSNYIFESFVVAPHNSFAYAACHAVAENPGNLYNPLFIYGKSGLGKTHLLHAIGNSIRDQQKKLFVLYQSADRFVQEFFNAIRFDTMHLFQSKYQAADVLLIDDIQSFVHKEATQEAFFQLFNVLYEMQKQIVCSGDTFPLEMNGITERLRSRLASGLIIDIHLPTHESKVTILKKKAGLQGAAVSDEVIDFLASHNSVNVRELEGILTRIFAFASLTKQPITLHLARSVLASSMHTKVENVGSHTDFNRIVKCVSKFYKYSIDDLCSKGRSQELAFARHVAMFLMKTMTNKSLRDIGSFLGNRSHATIKHGLIKIEEHVRSDHHFLAHIKRMQQDAVEL